MVKLAQALRPDEIEELKGLQDFYGQEYGGSEVRNPFTGEPRIDSVTGETRTVPIGDDPVLNPEVLDDDSLVKIIQHIDEEMFEIIGSYAAEHYRPGGEGSSFNGAPMSFTDEPPPSQEDLKPMWHRYITYQKYLVQRLSVFRLKIMEAECWFDEQGYLDHLNLMEMRKVGDPEFNIAPATPEELNRKDSLLEWYLEKHAENDWLPEREKDEAIMQTEE